LSFIPIVGFAFAVGFANVPVTDNVCDIPLIYIFALVPSQVHAKCIHSFDVLEKEPDGVSTYL
jgi:hypothetical protein